MLDLVQLNIERFRRLLNDMTDPNRRRTIEKLLREEEAKRHQDLPTKRGNSSRQK